MRNIRIIGCGAYLPSRKVSFGNETRYWCSDGETQLDMAEKACVEALHDAGLDISQIDCLVSASAVGVQPIPCTAALIHERVARGTSIPAFDINSTCTSFVTALDTMSYLVDAGRYRRVMIVSSDMASVGLNINQKTSYELFSDGACAFIIEKSDNPDQGVVASCQKTWSEGAHCTEIRGGLTAKVAKYYGSDTYDDYYFDMDGKKVLALCAKELPQVLDSFLRENDVAIQDIDLLVPHQASRVLPFMIRRFGFADGQFVDMVRDYGNQVSVSIPYMLYRSIKDRRVTAGHLVMLFGTAAGLTTNMLLIRL